MGLPLKVEVAGKYRTQEQNFNPLDRDRSAEENRHWGLPLITAPGKETVSEYTGGISLGEGGFAGSGLSFQAGQAEFGGLASSERVGGAGQMIVRGLGEAHIGLNHIVRKGVQGFPDEQINRLTFTANSRFAGFTPSCAFEREKVEGTGIFSHGSSYNDFLTHLTTPAMFGLTGEIEWFYRQEQAKHIAWIDSSLVRGGSIGLSRDRSVSSTMNMQYSRRERITGSSVVATDQAVFDYFYRPEKGFFRFDTTYRAGRSREASKRKNFIYTGGDRGSYRWEDRNNDGIRDPDEFVPDEHGSYYLYEETLGDYKPVNTVSAYGRLGMDIPTLILQKIRGAGAQFKTETTFEVNEKSSASASDVFLLNLTEFRKKGKTCSGDARIQEDITLPISDGRGSVRFRYFQFDALNAEYVTGAESRGEKEMSVRVRLPVNDYSDTELNIKQAYLYRSMEERQFGDYRVRSLSGDAGFSYYPVSSTKLGVNIGGGSDSDKHTSIQADYFFVKPSAAYHFSGKGRLEGSYTLTSVKLNNFSGRMQLPYTMAQGEKEGDNHDISLVCDYRLSQRMNLIVTYTGRKFGGQKFENFARVQVRALF
jgi:hypothetical protein